MRIITYKRSQLCKCEPMPHANHQLCQSCKRRVPVPLEVTAFTNSVSYCSKCPEDSEGGRLRDMFLNSLDWKVVIEEDEDDGN